MTIKQKVEAAFTGFLKQRLQAEGQEIWDEGDENSPGLAVLTSYHEGVKKTPAVICFAHKATEVGMPGSNCWLVDLYLYVQTHRDDEPASSHYQRLEYIQESILADEDAVKAALNFASGEDERAVKDFTLQGYYPEAAEDDRMGQLYGEHLRYVVACKGC